MIGALWNIRGLNKTCRIKYLSDFISNNKLDFIGIQETKKSEFSDQFLSLLDKRIN
jgi:exonuclease III